MPTPQQRVKVYEMTRDEWTDQGTGFCVGDLTEDGTSAWLVVRSEENRSLVLLKAPVAGSTRFQKQQDTLLVWSEPGRNDMALSFQDADGCACVCAFLVQVQKSVARDISVVVVTSTDEGETSELIAGPVSYPPIPTVDNLPAVLESISALTTFQFSREALCAFLVGSGFVPALSTTFYQAETNHLIAQLHNLCRIVKLIFGLNDSKVIERLVADDAVHGIIGALEYDPLFPEYKANLRAHFRFDRFKQVIPINDDQLLAKIRLTSRLQLLKDVLARLLDETTFGVMSSMIYFNQWSIVMSLQSTDYFSQIFNLYTIPYSQNSSLQRRRNGVKFIHSISLSTKGFQVPQKQKTFTSLAEKGLFALLQFAIADTDTHIQILGTDLLAGLIELDPQLVRGFVKAQIEFVINATLKAQSHNDTFSSQDASITSDTPFPRVQDNSLLQILISLFMSNTDSGLRLQVLESLKFLLDTEPEIPSSVLEFAGVGGSDYAAERTHDLFIKRFYDRYADSIFDLIRQQKIGESATGQNNEATKGKYPRVSSRLTPQNRSLYEQVCELLTFCIRMHGVKCQEFMAGTCANVDSNDSADTKLSTTLNTPGIGNGISVIAPSNQGPTPTLDGNHNIEGANTVRQKIGNQTLEPSINETRDTDSNINQQLKLNSAESITSATEAHLDKKQEASSSTHPRPNLWRGIAALLLSNHQTIQLAALRCIRQAINLLDESDFDFEGDNYKDFFEAISNKSAQEKEKNENKSTDFDRNLENTNQNHDGEYENENVHDTDPFPFESLDSHYALQLISSGCLDALVEVLCRTYHKTNLVNSACLEVMTTIYHRARGIIESLGLANPDVVRIGGIINGVREAFEKKRSQQQEEGSGKGTGRGEKDGTSIHGIPLKSLARLPGHVALACFLATTRGSDLRRLAMIDSSTDSKFGNASVTGSNSRNGHSESQNGVKRVVVGRMAILDGLMSLVDLISMQRESIEFLQQYQQEQRGSEEERSQEQVDGQPNGALGGEFFHGPVGEQNSNEFIHKHMNGEQVDNNRLETVQSSAAAAAVAVAVGKRRMQEKEESPEVLADGLRDTQPFASGISANETPASTEVWMPSLEDSTTSSSVASLNPVYPTGTASTPLSPHQRARSDSSTNGYLHLGSKSHSFSLQGLDSDIDQDVHTQLNGQADIHADHLAGGQVHDKSLNPSAPHFLNTTAENQPSEPLLNTEPEAKAQGSVPNSENLLFTDDDSEGEPSKPLQPLQKVEETQPSNNSDISTPKSPTKALSTSVPTTATPTPTTMPTITPTAATDLPKDSNPRTVGTKRAPPDLDELESPSKKRS